MQTYHSSTTGCLSYSSILNERAERALFVYDLDEVAETEWDAHLVQSDDERARFLQARREGRERRFRERSGCIARARKILKAAGL
jgi:hypothetical protein